MGLKLYMLVILVEAENWQSHNFGEWQSDKKCLWINKIYYENKKNKIIVSKRCAAKNDRHVDC